jgi:molybdopterin converting factor subunit 1
MGLLMGKTVEILYFGALREQRGCAEEHLETAAATPEELFEELRDRHGFSLTRPSLRVAVNDEFGSWQEPIQEGDRVVFIPPVAGG